jgi:predicted aspartyl protease
MLYINVEVNGHPVKAFVDSGAQTTISTPLLCRLTLTLRSFSHMCGGMRSPEVD